MPKHHTSCDQLEGLLEEFTSKRYFKRRVYKITSKIFDKTEINSKYDIFQHLVLNKKWKVVTLLNDLPPFETHNFIIEKKKINMLLMFSYLCVTEFLCF